LATTLDVAQSYTEPKETPNRMVQQEKMASICPLAAVVHEINNHTCLPSAICAARRFYHRANHQCIKTVPSRKNSGAQKKLKMEHIMSNLPERINK